MQFEISSESRRDAIVGTGDVVVVEVPVTVHVRRIIAVVAVKRAEPPPVGVAIIQRAVS